MWASHHLTSFAIATKASPQPLGVPLGQWGEGGERAIVRVSGMQISIQQSTHENTEQSPPSQAGSEPDG